MAGKKAVNRVPLPGVLCTFNAPRCERIAPMTAAGLDLRNIEGQQMSRDLSAEMAAGGMDQELALEEQERAKKSGIGGAIGGALGGVAGIVLPGFGPVIGSVLGGAAGRGIGGIFA